MTEYKLDLDRIFLFMRHNRLTQRAAGEKLGMAQSSLGMILNGKSNCTLKNLFKIADLMGVHPGELIIRGSDDNDT